MKTIPELLLPAGSLPVLKTALRFGADAVYLGGEAFSLRAKAKNFTYKEMAEGIRLAHAHKSPTHPDGAKVYVTANIIPHDRDLEEAEAYFDRLAELSPDGLLISDPGMFLLAKEHCPDIPLHISTQANNTNRKSFAFWKSLGASRVVAARELSLAELKGIREALPDGPEIETFVHGAMCISYSGRCLISAYLNHRPANLGECTHPCRWKYSVKAEGVEKHLLLEEETRPGELFPVLENDRGTFLFHSRDLCMIGHIPELIDAGISSLKVEGRMKNELYVGTVALAYRNALDDYAADPELYRAKIPGYLAEVKKTSARPYCTGFYFGAPGEEGQIYETSPGKGGAVFLGVIESAVSQGETLRLSFRQKNRFFAGDKIEILTPGGAVPCIVESMYDENGTRIESCPHPGRLTLIEVRGAGKAPEGIEAGDLIRGGG